MGPREFGFLVGADGPDHRRAKRLGPLADDQPDSAGGGMDQDRVAALHAIDLPQQHLRGHALKHHRRRLFGRDGVGQLHELIGVDQTLFGIAADWAGISDAVADASRW